MSEILVRRLRVSHVTGRIHDQVLEVGGDQAFARRLTDLRDVRGVPVELPFGEGLAPDTRFWRSIVERDLPTPLSEQLASHCRRSAMPLRVPGRMETSSDVQPRLEAHLHRFGVMAIATVDLHWTVPVTLEDASARLRLAEREAAVIDLAGRQVTTTIASAAVEAVGVLVSVLGDPRGQSWVLPSHRLTTVIDASGGESELQTMPSEGSRLHAVLHRLAGGDDAIPKPSRAFVAQFTSASYGFPPSRMVYMLSQGTAALLGTALAAEPQSPNAASVWHRERALLTAYVSALAGLVSASSQSANVMVPAWADTAAKMLARLYGPGRGYLEWGRFPAELLHRTGTAPDVASVLGAQLAYNADYPFDAYEAAAAATDPPTTP